MLAVLLVLIAMEMPIAFAMAISGTVGILLLRSPHIVTVTLASLPYLSSASYTLTVIPMYVLLGVLAIRGRLGDELFALAERVFRRVPGGLGIASIGAAAGFGAVSGSTVAAAVAMGRLTIPRMLRNGYTKPFASGIASVGGTLDALIPPSIILVVYAVITQVPTGAMLIAGILPGLLSAILYSVYIRVRASRRWRRPVIVSTGITEALPKGFPIDGLIRAALLFGVVIGGIYSGLFTPTEAGAVGALVAFLMLAYDFRKRGRQAFGKVLWITLKETAATTSMILIIIVGAGLFSAAVVLTGVPQQVAGFVGDLNLNPTLLMIIIIIVLLPLGMFLEGLAAVTVVVPFIAPIMAEVGVDPIWAGILIVKTIAIGMIAPPIGIIPYIVAGTVRDLKVADVFRGVLPLAAIDFLVILILLGVPQIVTILPALMGER